MARTDALLLELIHETKTTRKHLARLPTERFGWRPHAKSYTAGDLGAHLVDCVRWVVPTFSGDELELDPKSYRPFVAQTVEALLQGFDAEVTRAQAAMAEAGDRDATQLWRLKMKGKVWFEKTREDVFRDMTLNHLIHHRGQLSVYLRLLEIAVPGSYGPTADDA